MGNAVTADKSILIHDPDSIDTLRENGKNTLFIPWVSWMQLYDLRNKPDVGTDAKECIERIEKIRESGDPTLVLWKEMIPFNKEIKFMDKKNIDHQVIATALSIKRKNAGKFEKFKFLSRKAFVRTTAREIDNNGLLVENYTHDRVEVEDSRKLKRIQMTKEDFYQNDLLYYRPEIHGKLIENEGVVCHYEALTFPAIKRGLYLKIIPNYIGAFGLKPKILANREENWAQHIALYQLLAPSIPLVFLEGGAGTGKTLLAMACALEQRRYYRQIAVTRPMIHLENEDRIGLLPGDIHEKMEPWLRPLWTCLDFLKGDKQTIEMDGEEEDNKRNELNLLPDSKDSNLKQKKLSKREKKRKMKESKNREIAKRFLHDEAETSNETKKYSTHKDIIAALRAKGKIIVEPLSFIRGMSIPDTYVILDEGQNTSPHVVKTTITRSGEGTKIVITGDLTQVDDKKLLDKHSNGLAYAMARMGDNPLVGITRFENNDSVRSPLVRLALDRM